MIPLLVTDSWGNELLCVAAEAGCLPVIERLFDEAGRNPELRAELLRDRPRQIHKNRHDRHQSVGEAVKANHVDVVRYLLRQPGIEPHLHHRDLSGWNVFHMANRHANPEVVRLLIGSYPEGVDEYDDIGDAALLVFVFDRVTASVEEVEAIRVLLTLGGADMVGAKRKGDYSSLRCAVRNGNVDICRVLVEVGGADPRDALQIDNGRVVGLLDDDNFRDKGRAEATTDVLCRLGGLRRAKGREPEQLC